MADACDLPRFAPLKAELEEEGELSCISYSISVTTPLIFKGAGPLPLLLRSMWVSKNTSFFSQKIFPTKLSSYNHLFLKKIKL